MPSKSILKKTEPVGEPAGAAPDAAMDDEIILEDDMDSAVGGGETEEQEGGAPGKKPTFKITKKITKAKPTEKVDVGVVDSVTGVAKKVIIKETVKPDKAEKAEKIDRGEEVLVEVNKAIKATSKKTSRRQDSGDLFNDDDIDYRFIMANYDFTKNKTLPRITKYEKSLLVGKRAKQIEEGANPNVKVLPGQNAIEIAEEELRQRKIPFIIKRPIGNKFEYWKPADMEVMMD